MTTTYTDTGRECDCCSSSAPLTKTLAPTVGRSRLGDPDDPFEYLCQFCYETHLGNILRYRHYDGNTQQLARGLCQALSILARGKS